MSEYTPTTEEVETHWADVGFAGDRASFRRWLAVELATAKAEVWADPKRYVSPDGHSRRDDTQWRFWLDRPRTREQYEADVKRDATEKGTDHE